MTDFPSPGMVAWRIQLTDMQSGRAGEHANRDLQVCIGPQRQHGFGIHTGLNKQDVAGTLPMFSVELLIFGDEVLSASTGLRRHVVTRCIGKAAMKQTVKRRQAAARGWPA